MRYTEGAIREIAELDDPEALMVELERVLAQDPHRPPGRRARKVQGMESLWRYRPHMDNNLRVFYRVRGDQVWILALHPRSQAYRDSNLRTALERFWRSREG